MKNITDINKEKCILIRNSIKVTAVFFKLLINRRCDLEGTINIWPICSQSDNRQ